MKEHLLDNSPDFLKMLKNLGDVRNVCLLTGGGWKERLAWNPCDSYSLPAGKNIDDGLQRFIETHREKGNLVVGAISYELGYELYGIKNAKRTEDLPGAVLFAYDNYLEKRRGKVFACYTHKSFLTEISEIMITDTDKISGGVKPSFMPIWNREAYTRAYEKIREYIYEGYIYQINLTQEMKAEYDGNSRLLFAGLSGNQAKMKAYLECEGFEILSLSPERFIRVEGSAIETAPIKGTRPRGKNQEEDEKNEAELLSDEKEKAELNMITDLLRNDLGKVCAPGTVEVSENKKIEKLSNVMHTYSRIIGKLKPDIAPFSALISMFPGGSITGCPKKKAMEIINELELSGRGFYCGNLFALDNEGLDSSILIRTLIKRGRQLSMSVGSGIVYDSLEENEYQENLDKAKITWKD